MIIIFCGLVVTLVCLAVILVTQTVSFIFELPLVISVFALFAVICIYAGLGYGYIAADYKANIINREYNTSYTQEEVFFASDVIETIREIDRKRVEINGDIITGK